MITVQTPYGIAAQLSVAGLVKTTLQLPVRSDGYRARRLRIYCADASVAFTYGDWDQVARVAADPVNDCGCPRLPAGIPIVIDTAGAEYIAFKRPNFDATISTVQVECLDAGALPISGLVEVDDNYFTRYIQPLDPVQGYHLDSAAGLQDLVEFGGITTRDAIWQGGSEYSDPTETILGGLGSTTLRTSGAYTYVTGDKMAIDLDQSATMLLWCRYWDGNGNGLVVGNTGPQDYIDTSDGLAGWRNGFIGSDMNVYVSDSTGGLANTNNAGAGSLKTVAGNGGNWFLNAAVYDGDAQTFTSYTLSDGVALIVPFDTSAAVSSLNPPATTSGRWRHGAAYGLATWEGSICEAYAFAKALTQSELFELFFAGYPGASPILPSGFSSGFDSGYGL